MQLIGSTWAPDRALQFVNAFELVLMIAALAVVARYIVGEIHSWRDFGCRIRRILLHNYQGGGYDLAIGFAVILFGEALRRGLLWEWRTFGGRLSLDLLVLAVVIIGAGALCVVRVMTRCPWYNAVWLSVLAAALAFGYWSISA